jgi:hypothetical protein
VRRGPKGADEGSTGELTEGEIRWCGGGGSVDRHGHEAKERGRGDGVLGRARKGG